LAVAVITAAVTLVFFSPRFANWQGVGYPEVPAMAEFGRARYAVVQLEHLRAPIDSPYHKVIAWRLLLPVIWHFLRLPAWLYLAMPAAGCLLALWLVAWLSYGRYGDWVETWLTTAVFAALPWFFVSTGWLAYFDSWLVIGLLLAAFIPSRILLGLTCFLTPWIDERFVLAIPVAFSARMVCLRRIEDRDWHGLRLDLAVIFLASLPYPAIRAAAWLSGDPDSTAYVQRHLDEAHGVPPVQYLLGLWSGYRAGWLLILAAVLLWWRRVGWVWGAIFAMVMIATAIGGLFIAADMTRTLMMLSPVLLLGAWLWKLWRPETLRWVLAAILAANLLLPANHVMWGLTFPIRGLPAEIDRWNNPPQPLAVARLIRLGNSLLERREFAQARDAFTAVIRLDESAWGARLRRALASAALRDIDGANADVDAVLRIQPTNPDALFIRAALRHERGDVSGAAEDLQQALLCAPQDWPLGAKARESLEKLLNGASPEAKKGVP